MDDLVYKPDSNVVRSARYFIRSLCEAYGASQGMAVWDSIRTTLGETAASDIFLGMLTNDFNVLRVTAIGQYKIEAIKEIRGMTGWGLKESKDFVDEVSSGTVKEIDVAGIDMSVVDNFRRAMARHGCKVE